MKVLKFGGTSLSSVESLHTLSAIVSAGSREDDIIVVVSALHGVTDGLLRTASLAADASPLWRAALSALSEQHTALLAALALPAAQHTAVGATLDSLFSELESLCYGLSLLRDLSAKTSSTIVSYGERLSAALVCALLPSATYVDSRELIKTTPVGSRATVDMPLTTELIRAALTVRTPITVVPGFIASDRDSHDTTTLGRGGSDFSASLLAAALDASVLEIWTDVDGFMTADPRVIKTAYTISELSYVEATELCNFGAKVIYPPTIYPVCVKNIPILVRNTFNPTGPSTRISARCSHGDKAICGISSISGTSLVHVTGLSMVGVIGVNQRIFTALTHNGISVFMVAQASSENSTSIGVRSEEAAQAAQVLNEEFSKEISTGAMYPMRIEEGLATVAIVGENMRHDATIAGKLFGTLGRSGISVIAFAQGAAGTNISFVVPEAFLRKSLNVIHDSFFLSEYNVLNLFICGVGTVGGMLIEQIRTQYEHLKESRHLKLNVVGIASSRHAIFSRDGLDLDNYPSLLAASAASDTEQLIANVIGMNTFNAVFVDCTASDDIAACYQQLLEHNISVVAANKVAAAGPYSTYATLKATALQRGVKYLFETNVGAGLPIIGTINDLRASGDKILKIEAVLSGTLNYIFNTLSAAVPFSQAVRRAVEQGYAEPDPRIDLSGKDVVRKLVILAREAGYNIEQDAVAQEPLVPSALLTGTIDSFWQQLPQLDAPFEARRRTLAATGARWRFVATLAEGHATVALRTVTASHPFYSVEGSNNIVLLTTERYKEYPMLIQGYGAGASVTAAGVFANIMSIANI